MVATCDMVAMRDMGNIFGAFHLMASHVTKILLLNVKNNSLI